VFNIGLPIVSYSVLTGHGVGTVPALALSGVWPLGELLLTMFRDGHADEFSIFTLVGLGLGIVSSLLLDSPRLALVKDSAITGLFGIALLVSLLFGRPLMFYFGRKFATDGSPEGVDWWNGLWRHPEFRRSQRILTVVWGLSFIAEAGLRIALTYALSTSTMVVINSVLPYIVLGILIAGTAMYGRRAGAAARRRRSAEGLVQDSN